MLSILEELRIFYNPYFLFLKMNNSKLYDVYRVETLDGKIRYTYVPSGDLGKSLMDKLSVRVYGIVIDGEGLDWNYAQDRMWELENRNVPS